MSGPFRVCGAETSCDVESSVGWRHPRCVGSGASELGPDGSVSRQRQGLCGIRCQVSRSLCSEFVYILGCCVATVAAILVGHASLGWRPPGIREVDAETERSGGTIVGASAGVVAAAISLNPVLAADPVAIAAIAGVANVAGSATADLANGKQISLAKAAVAGVGGAVAGPAGARVGNAVETALGRNASSVVGETFGAATGESVAAGLGLAGPAVSKAAERLSDAGKQAVAEVKQVAREQLDPERNRYR